MIRRTHRSLTGIVVATFVAATLVVLTGTPAEAAGQPCRKTYSSTGLPIAIPDANQSGVSMNVNVPDTATVADVDVTVNITHEYDRDLWVYLNRGSSYVTLAARVGDSGNDFLNTVFDDEAALGIGAGNAPFSGRFQPVMPLSRLDGGSVSGSWAVGVVDQAGGGTGFLNGWSMTIEFTSCDFDGDGVEDHRDRCLGLSAATATGCPLAGRTVTSTYRKGAFRGALASTKAACRTAKPVTIWKVRSGPDRKVGTAVTRSDGTYRLPKARRLGRYYATTPTVAVTDVAQCSAATSAVFRIR